MKHLQQSFQGGYNRLFDTTRVERNEYPFLMNGRTRFDVVEPIAQPVELTGLPNGKIQALYAAGNLVLVFIDGAAYYKDYSIAGNFVLVDGFKMDSNVDRIYIELIPASTVNFIRKQTNASDIGAGVLYTGTVIASPQCVVIQDGINQPWIIQADGSTRITQTYAQWTQDSREYVPIGKQMLYYNGILYIVSSDGKQIFRSVTGRPLDFMVKIDVNGDKLLEADGKADTISHKVDFDTITAIRWINTSDGSFFVSTARNSYLVTPLTDMTIYAEPTFRNTPLFNTGALNQFSVVDILGDTALIDFNGIRSFNAVQQLNTEGRNAPFSSKIQHLFNNIIQVDPVCIDFNNYAFFAVNTTYGQVVVVYDTLTQKYVGIDRYTMSGVIKQFASVKTTSSRKLLCYTTENKVYELFGDTTVEEISIYLGDFCSGNPEVQQKPTDLSVVFIDSEEAGVVTVTTYTDRLKGKEYSSLVKESVIVDTYPLIVPFGVDTVDRSKVINISLNEEKEAWRYGFLISWKFKGKLSHISTTANESKMSYEQMSLEESGNRMLPKIDEIQWNGLPNQKKYINGTDLYNIVRLFTDQGDIQMFFVGSAIMFIVPNLPAGTYELNVELSDGYILEIGHLVI